MSDFNQDMQNLLNAYDSNWEDYLILREQFIEKYSLSVEKLQEQNKTMKLALVELSDENIYDNTGFFANEYAKNLVEQLDAGEIETIVERCNRNLQEQLNTMKAALIVVRADIEEHNQIYDLSVDTALLLEGIDGIAFDALAAIGGDDER